MIRRCFKTELLPTEARYGIAFDPGINRTGYCVWSFTYRKPVEVGALVVPNKGFVGKRLALLLALAEEILSSFRIRCAVVEEFQPFVKKDRPQLKLMKTSLAQGALYGLCVGRGIPTTLVSKGKAPKQEADLICKSLGVWFKDQEKHLDEKDAVHLAWLQFGGKQ